MSTRDVERLEATVKELSASLDELIGWVYQVHPDEFVDWIIAKRTPGFHMETPQWWRNRFKDVLADACKAAERAAHLSKRGG